MCLYFAKRMLYLDQILYVGCNIYFYTDQLWNQITYKFNKTPRAVSFLWSHKILN